jgi:flagellar P-ring protein precursor FlgI
MNNPTTRTTPDIDHLALLAMFIAWLAMMLISFPAQAQRIKDIANLQGVRENQLVGYGLVVGLDGTGDQTTQTPFTTQSMTSMLNQMGVTMPSSVATQMQLKNVAAVMVTASLMAFSRPGQRVDVTVSSLGNAKSLRGGTLMMTPLKGIDGNVYAIAQGNVLVAGVGASSGGSSVQVNHLNVGRIPTGATVERSVPTPVGQGEFVYLDSLDSDFTTVSRIVRSVNQQFGDDTAQAVDGRQVRVKAPWDPGQRVEFMARLENLSVTPGDAAPKVIVNARTGSVVMNQLVRVGACAVAHGNLSVTISTESQVSQPNALAQGTTVTTEKSSIEVKSDKSGLVVLPNTTSLTDVVKALNAVGVTPLDLLAILQAMKAAGALRAELEVI